MAFSGIDEPSVLVRKGLILRGVLDKASIGSSANGLVHAVFELYGGRAAADLLDALTRLLTSYLATVEGHTCGIGDLVLTDQAEKARKAIVEETEQVGIEAMESFLKREATRTGMLQGYLRQNEQEEDATPRTKHWGRTARAKRSTHT